MIQKWREETRSGRNPREIKVLFAKEIVQRFHGASAARKAGEDFEKQQQFRYGALPDSIPERTFPAQGPEGNTVVATVTAAGLSSSNSESARLVEQGGVTVDGVRVADRSQRIRPGTTVVIKVGKHKFIRVTIK